MTNHKRTSTLKQRMPEGLRLTHKATLFAVVIFSCSLIALGSLTYTHLQEVAGKQHRHTQQEIAKQLAKLSAPLILSHNLISLNTLLQNLIDSNSINGAAIYNAQNKMLAKTGSINPREVDKITIRSNDVALGSLHIEIARTNLQPSFTTLMNLMWPNTLLIGMICLFFGWWFGSRLTQPMSALHDAQEQLLLYQRSPPLDVDRTDEWGVINSGFNDINEQRLLHAYNDQQRDLFGKGLSTPSQADSPRPDVFHQDIHDLARELSDSNTQQIGDPLLNPKAAPTGRGRILPIVTMDDVKFDAIPNLDNEPLVTDGANTNIPPATLANTPAPDGLEELIRATDRNPLVSLLYINFNTRDQGPMEAEEKHRLLSEYQRLVMQVCSIYSGDIQRQLNQDVLVAFGKPEDHMTHCVNALCAAQFFLGLYQSFNNSLKAANRPKLNVQVVVHTGPYEDASLLAQQAIDLSHQLRIDDIMISRQVAYHPELQQRILELSHCQLLTNGAFSLSRLSQEYQDLLDAQIRHYSAHF